MPTSEQNDLALIEYYRGANSDLTVSDLAILIHVRGTGAMSRQAMVSAVDAELQEVRDVLSLTTDRRYPEGSHGHCWCRKDLTDDSEPHNEFCRRARALWSKLQIGEANQVQEQEKSNV